MGGRPRQLSRGRRGFCLEPRFQAIPKARLGWTRSEEPWAVPNSCCCWIPCSGREKPRPPPRAPDLDNQAATRHLHPVSQAWQAKPPPTRLRALRPVPPGSAPPHLTVAPTSSGSDGKLGSHSRLLSLPQLLSRSSASLWALTLTGFWNSASVTISATITLVQAMLYLL